MNLERWKSVLNIHEPPNCMDWRHIQMVNRVLTRETPQSVVEIGSYKGASTAAIIEAHERKPFHSVDVIDVKITPELRAACPKDFNLLEIKSDHYLGNPECWIIDGDHGAAALVDYHMARQSHAKIIIIHDSNAMAHPKLQFNHGAAEIAKRLRADAEFSFEDKKERRNEMTHRGLLIGFFYKPFTATFLDLEDLTL